MRPRQRQFSQQRSTTTSRAHSQMGRSAPTSFKSSLLDSLNKSVQEFQHDCATCINKKLTRSRSQSIKQKQELEINQHLETIKRIHSMRDSQRQLRQQKLIEAAKFNKSMASSRIQSLKSLKLLEHAEGIKQNQNIGKSMAQKQKNYQKNRVQLQSNHQIELKKQLEESRARKSLEDLSSKFEDLSEVNRLQIIEENERYVMKVDLEKKNCQRQNKILIFQKSLAKHQEKLRKINDDTRHMEAIEHQFQSFTQFQPLQNSPYRTSRSTIFSSQNPEDPFNTLKKIQTEKQLTRIAQRETNNQKRALELKRIEEENIKMMKKKISSMKSYVEDLTSQVLEKRKRETTEERYQKQFKPQNSQVDYFTEELGKQVLPCHSCDRLLEKRYLGL